MDFVPYYSIKETHEEKDITEQQTKHENMMVGMLTRAPQTTTVKKDVE